MENDILLWLVQRIREDLNKPAEKKPETLYVGKNTPQEIIDVIHGKGEKE